jgi:hypothetical protein
MMGIDYTCEDCGESTATLDENVLHDLVRDIRAGDRAGAFRNLDILVADMRNADALQERIAIAKVAV